MTTSFFAIAISDYRSDEEKDLTFERGDKIRILIQHNSGWWEGDLNGKKGFFPKSFVQLEGVVEVQRENIYSVFLCNQNFDSPGIGEIELLTGDLVYVDFIVKERCSGTNLRNLQRGMFPITLLERTIQKEEEEETKEKADSLSK